MTIIIRKNQKRNVAWLLIVLLFHHHHHHHHHFAASAWKLHTSWAANPNQKSVLAITSLPQAGILATAGHEGGTIRFWKQPSRHECCRPWNLLVATSNDDDTVVHTKSIFALDSHEGTKNDHCYILSGSLDRSAIVQQILFNHDEQNDNAANDSLKFETVATLPEHTGWVRDVCIVKMSHNDDNCYYYLSIGCNLINVFTAIHKTSLRLARLDAGPSSSDEESFRRHDILCMAVVADDMIVAGLVDGTLRAFATKWEKWKTNNDVSNYDATGSCKAAAVEDDKPFARVQAHHGCRVYGVHVIVQSQQQQQQKDGVRICSIGEKDCCLWSIRNEEFVLVSRTPIINDDQDDKISCSILVNNCILVVGTTLGCLYKIDLESLEEEEEMNNYLVPYIESIVWNGGEDDEDNDYSAITSLAWVPPQSSEKSDDIRPTLVAGNANGYVGLFR